MNNPAAPGHRKHTDFAAQFFNQWHRYKTLLSSYWWIVLSSVALALVIEWFLLARAPSTFISTGRMIVNVKLSIPNANIYSEELNNFFGTQVELMQSDSVVNRVNLHLQSASPSLHPSPVSIKVTLSPKTSIFNLSALGKDASYTRAYLEATMEEYVNMKKELLANASTITQSSIREELKQVTAELQKSTQDLLNYQSSNTVVFLQSSGGNNAADYLSSLTTKMAEYKSELQLLKTLTLDQNLEREAGIFSHQRSGANPPPPTMARDGIPSQPATVDSTLTSSTSHAPPTGRLANNDTEFNASSTTLGTFEVAYLQAKQQLLLLKAKQSELGKVLSPTATALVAVNEEIARQETLLRVYEEQSAEQLKNRQRTLALQIRDLENQIAEWNLVALDASKKLSDFQGLKENQKRLQTIYDQMQSTLHALDVDKGIRQESVTIFEPATSAMPAPRKLAKHLGMAGLLGLVLGAGILLLLNQLDDCPRSFTELEVGFHETIIGQIPLMPRNGASAGEPILRFDDDDRHALVESFSNLRSALLFKDTPDNHPKSIVVTSAIPNDGKSTVCANLAITFAQSGARVLLVDADLRRGALHKRFSTSGNPGLSEVLSEQCLWTQALVRTAIPNLDFIPRGLTPRRPASLFVTHTDKFLEQVADHYDYCFIDTAPVMAADDVASLAPRADSLIMVVRAGFTPGRIARAALNLLYLRKVNVTGLVFNAVPTRTGEYHFYQYKEYHMENTIT